MGNNPDFPVSVSSLHFPSTELPSVSQTLASLRRSALSVNNRLRSIDADAAFVREVADHYGLPLVANERCGSWYIPPEIKSGSAYFKSTDGHTGQWDFSFRRLNLQILPLAREHGGYVSHAFVALVDVPRGFRSLKLTTTIRSLQLYYSGFHAPWQT